MKPLLRMMVCLCLAASSALFAQQMPQPSVAVRSNIPKDAPKAKFRFVEDRTVELNGTRYRLSPGAVIRDQNNVITMTTRLVGMPALPSRVQLDPRGDVHRVWILTPGEQAQDAPTLK